MTPIATEADTTNRAEAVEIPEPTPRPRCWQRDRSGVDRHAGKITAGVDTDDVFGLRRVRWLPAGVIQAEQKIAAGRVICFPEDATARTVHPKTGITTGRRRIFKSHW